MPKWLGLLALIFLPSFALAANINELNDNIVVNDEKSQYRYRSNPGLWQKSELLMDEGIDQVVFEGSLYLTTQKNGSFHLYRSTNGLTFMEIQTSPSAIELRIIENLLAVNDQQVTVIDKNHEITNYPLPSPGIGGENIQLFEELLLFFQPRSSGVDIFDLTISSTQPQWSLNCSGWELVDKPIPQIHCDDVVYVFENGQLNQLLSGVSIVSESQDITLWQKSLPNEFVIFDGASLTNLLFSDYSPTDQLSVVSNRLFWSRATGMFEVSWKTDPINVVSLPLVGALRQSQSKIILTGTTLYYSASFGHWQETNLSTSNWELLLAHGRLVAFLPGGSLTFVEQGAGQFTAMTDTWAASSKIKAVSPTAAGGLLLVLRNSSNNPNVYRSTDLASWQRLSMPSFITVAVAIEQARSLPANSAVELSGKITVKPGWVSDTIGYLEDDSGAIQFYLSSTRGQLVVDHYRQATIIGKISSSQVARVLLDDPNQLILGSRYQFSAPKQAIKTAKVQLGRIFILQGEVNSLQKDSFVLTDKSDEIKVHYPDAKTLFSAGVEVGMAVVVDYNVVTKDTEAWYTGDYSKIISNPPTIESSPAPLTRSSTGGSPKTVVKVTSPTPALAVTTNTLSDKSMPVTALVSTEKQTERQNVWLYLIAGITAGVLVSRGRRFGQSVIFDN